MGARVASRRTGLHGHFAVGRYVPHTLIREAWGRGHVHIKLLGDLPAGSGALEEARLAARYLAPYASKPLDEPGRPVCIATRSPKASVRSPSVAKEPPRQQRQ